jgi:hypothetical protein
MAIVPLTPFTVWCPSTDQQVDLKDRWRNLLRKDGGVVGYYAYLRRQLNSAEPEDSQVMALGTMAAAEGYPPPDAQAA